MTREDAIKIIRDNSDMPINEIKRKVKAQMPIEQRSKFTSEHIFQLILEMNEMDLKRKRQYKNKIIKKIEGEER